MGRVRAAAARSFVSMALWSTGAGAGPSSAPVLHEPIAPDPSEDLAMHVILEGDLPAALLTSAGPVSGPDPRDPPSPGETAYDARAQQDPFRPDRDPQASDGDYDEPFTPSTAPFKRMAAFDAVRPDYELYVRDARLTAVTPGAGPGPDDDAFYMNAVVELSPDRRIRIPSVGPGARIVKGHMGIGAQSVSYVVSRDGADNWYVQGVVPRSEVRARLVLEVAIPRATFGGPLADLAWSELPPVPPLPANVARDAERVFAAIGVSRQMRPREAVATLVEYFRGFSESDQPVPRRGSVYVDLALSKKGVCRHRAFAFMVTALQLGIPTRLAQSDVHAWVEVHDGARWHTIDLGGAGRLRTRTNAQQNRPAYLSPADTFPWPQGAKRSRDAFAEWRPKVARDEAVDAGPAPSGPPIENRPPSSISLTVGGDGVRRGLPLYVRGEVRANGQACPGAAVELLLRSPRTEQVTLLGILATASDGTFVGSVVVPPSAPVGDYDVVARTEGNARCGRGQN